MSNPKLIGKATVEKETVFGQIISNYLSIPDEERPADPELTEDQQIYLASVLKDLGWKISK